MKFSIKDFFSKYDQIHSFLRTWSHLLNKSLTKIALIVNAKTNVFDFDFEHVLDQLFYVSVIYRKQRMVPEAV